MLYVIVSMLFFFLQNAVNKAFGDMGSGDFSGYSDNTYSHNTIVGGTSSVARIA